MSTALESVLKMHRNTTSLAIPTTPMDRESSLFSHLPELSHNRLGARQFCLDPPKAMVTSNTLWAENDAILSRWQDDRGTQLFAGVCSQPFVGL